MNLLLNADARQIPLDDKSVNLIVADPPYNIGKAHWDKIPDYTEWCGLWLKECQRVLADNGSMYIFHNDMEQVADLMLWIRENTEFVFKQFITWSKINDGFANAGFVQQRLSIDMMRNYYGGFTEYILFYTFQDETGLTKIMDSCVDPIRNYIRSEILKAKGYIKFNEINAFFGTATNGGGVASAVLSENKTVPAMITEEHYLKLRDYCNGNYLRREYEDLRREYEDLRREYEDLRYTFNTTRVKDDLHANSNVWLYQPAKRNGHETPKPVELIKNIIVHSSNKGDLVLDPFVGSGTTVVACEQAGRRGIGLDLSWDYLNTNARERLVYGSYVPVAEGVNQLTINV